MLQQMPDGVWERVGKMRFPVEQKYGPSTGHMMQDDDVSEKMTKKMINRHYQWC